MALKVASSITSVFPTNSCSILGSEAKAISPNCEESTGTCLHPKIESPWALTSFSKIVLQKSYWLVTLGKNTIPTAYALCSGILKSQTRLK